MKDFLNDCSHYEKIDLVSQEMSEKDGSLIFRSNACSSSSESGAVTVGIIQHPVLLPSFIQNPQDSFRTHNKTPCPF